MPFSKLPYARICIILVRHSGPSLTNESAEAITRPNPNSVWRNPDAGRRE